MKLLTTEEIRKYIPRCTEIRMCPELDSCIKTNKRQCKNILRPCYIAFNTEKLEGTIKLNFKDNIINVNRLNEDRDYVKIIRPDKIETEIEGKENKEKTKKILDSWLKSS